MRLSATRTYYFIRISYGLLFGLMGAVSAVYRVDVVGLNPLQLILVGTVLEVAFFSAEIPTGIIADVYSRKLSLIIGYITIGVGFLIEGLIPQFRAVLLSQVVWGIGATFLSGAETAWLAGEVGDAKLTGLLIRGSQIGAVVGIAGILTAMVIGSFDLSLGFIVAGLGCILLGLILIPLMPETEFSPSPNTERSTWGKMSDTFRAGTNFVKQNRVLQLIIIIELCIGLSDEGLQRLREPLLLQEFTFPTLGGFAPIVWLGAINIGIRLMLVPAIEVVKRRIDESNSIGILRNFRTFFTLSAVFIVIYAWSINFTMAVVVMMIGETIGSIAFPLYDAWIAQQIDKDVRATVLSMWGQVNAIGQIIGGPAIGLLATLTTLRLGYSGIALFMIPVPFLVAAILKHYSVSTPPESDT